MAKAVNKEVKPRNTGVVKKLLKYYGLNYFNECALTQPIAEAIAEDMFNWACKERDTALTLEEFAQSRGIPLTMLHRWRRKFPCIDKAYKESLPYIGNNRELCALKRTVSERVALRSMSQYSSRWKDLEQWFAKLNKDDRSAFEKLVFEIKDLTTKEKEETSE